MADLPARSRRRLWLASARLAEAEALARYVYIGQDLVEPPSDRSELPAWIESWAARADRTLERARAWARQKNQSALDTARELARRVREGAEAVWEVARDTSPYGQGKRHATRVINAAKSIEDSVASATAGAVAGVSAVLILLAIYLLATKGG